MTTTDALELMLEALETRKIPPLKVMLTDTMDIGPVCMVALASLSGCLPFCSAPEDLLAAVRFGVRMYLSHKIAEPTLISRIKEVIEEVSEQVSKEAAENASN